MEILLFLIIAILAYFISAVLHELGHIFAGLIYGFKFYMLVVGPIGLKRDTDGKLKLYFEKNVSLWAGVGGTVPANTDSHEKNLDIFSKILLAGPIFSIICGIILLSVSIWQENLFFCLLGAMPLGMGIACLIPMRAGAFYSDGGRWKRIHNLKTRDIEMAIFKISTDAGIEDDGSEINKDDVSVLINSDDAITQYLGRYFLCCYYRDTNQTDMFEEEKVNLSALGESVPNSIRKLFLP
jgi:hypothetical protein